MMIDALRSIDPEGILQKAKKLAEGEMVLLEIPSEIFNYYSVQCVMVLLGLEGMHAMACSGCAYCEEHEKNPIPHRLVFARPRENQLSGLSIKMEAALKSN